MTVDRLQNWVDAVERRWLWLIIGALMVRALFLFGNGLDLIGDESYYWDWSRRPDWCYFSKPPMVAWVIAAFTWLFGDYTVVVRLPTLWLGTMFLLYFHATAKAFYGGRAAALALLLIVATPINALANFLMTIDPLLYCFWMMALFYLRRALFDGQQRAWLSAGCASALALLSKQGALLLPALLALFLLIDRRRWQHFSRNYWLYLTPLLIAAVPILWWNLQHDWVMFGHSRGHFGNHQPFAWSKHLKQAGDFVLYQVLLLSPLLWLLLMVLTVQMARRFRQLQAEQQFLWLMGPVMLLAMLLLSLLQKVQGNWPMAFYFSAIILLAGRWVNGGWSRSIKASLVVGYLLVSMTYSLPALLQVTGLKGTSIDPTKRFNSWHVLAAEIDQYRQGDRAQLVDSFVIAIGHRYLASQLAFYLPDHPQVFRFETSGQVETQYEVWPGAEAFVGQNAWIIGGGKAESLPPALMAAFSRITPIAEVANPDKAKATYTIYRAERLIAWPTLDQRTSIKD